MNVLSDYKKLDPVFKERGLDVCALVLTASYHKLSSDDLGIIVEDLGNVKPIGAVVPYLRSICREDLLYTYSTVKSELDFYLEEE